MVSFNDSGTEAEALSEWDNGGGRRRGRTKFTSCRYCGKSFPLHKISAHAKNAHYEESTKYTDCRKCGGKFPLREIRTHSRACDGTPAEPQRINLAKLVEDAETDARKVEKVFAPLRSGPGDTFRVERESFIPDFVRQIAAEEDRVLRDAVIEYLRKSGYVVEKVGDSNVSNSAVAFFRAAWVAADKAGRAGNRVRAGLAAAHPFMNQKAVELIDELRPDPVSYAGSLKLEAVAAVLDELRDLIAPGAPRPGEVPQPCRCTFHNEDRGGGYTELVLEPEPDCPLHGTAI